MHHEFLLIKAFTRISTLEVNCWLWLQHSVFINSYQHLEECLNGVFMLSRPNELTIWKHQELPPQTLTASLLFVNQWHWYHHSSSMLAQEVHRILVGSCIHVSEMSSQSEICTTPAQMRYTSKHCETKIFDSHLNLILHINNPPPQLKTFILQHFKLHWMVL